MKLLILGGTVFLGRHIVDDALRRGHEVTLFNRGQHNTDLYPHVEKLRGDRDGNLDALKGRQWDIVIDTSGYVPRLVGDSAKLLTDSAEHYSFVSSISVYADFAKIGIDEEYDVGVLEDETVEGVDGETYGPLKALCEQAAEAAMAGRVLNVRAGLIVGPHDQTDRFTYWPHRIAQGGEVLAPVGPDWVSQFIDARDLAAWIVQMAAQRKAGTYNVTGVPQPIGGVIDTCRTVSGSDAVVTWASDEFLVQNEVAPWSEMPLWLPAGYEGMEQVSIAKALTTGLTFRSVAETVADTLAWAQERPGDYQWRAGLDQGREAELLQKWHTK